MTRSLALLAALLLPLPQATAHTLTETGEWVVACDNAATCSVVNAARQTQLRVAQPSPFGMSRICIHRRGGAADEARVFLSFRRHAPATPATRQEERVLRIVGANPAQPDIVLSHYGGDHWQAPAAEVRRLLAGLDETTQLHVVARDGTTLERLSVDGIDQALSIVDRAQRRTGGVTALRQTGSTPAGSAPALPPIPGLVTAPLAPLAPAPAPSAAALGIQGRVCGAPGPDATVGYRLLGDRQRADRILWVMRCDARPGLRRDLFVIETADGSAAPAVFPGLQPDRPTGQDGVLATPRLDAATGLVREQWIAPVPPPAGEACAIQRLWGFNGHDFELAEERRSLSCAGIASGYWARTYTRALVTPAPLGAGVTAVSAKPPC